MTDEEINIKIAEACGWTSIHPNGPYRANGIRPDAKYMTVIPNYCNDLNAMHEAEKALTYEQKYEYAKNFVDFELVFANARQRALAFLSTLSSNS